MIGAKQSLDKVNLIKQRLPILEAFRRYIPTTKVEKETTNRYKAVCPFHDDKNPSLKIWTDQNKWHCFGCKLHGDAISLVAEVEGLNNTEAIKFLINDLGLAQPSVKEVQAMQRKIVEQYDYVDSEGTLLYQAIRYEPKEFRQRRPSVNGGWTWKTQGIEPVPYQLPQLLEAINAGKTIYITEGEKDCHSLIALGLNATCNHGGAGKWKECHTKYFPRGCNIVIFPDNDIPGRSHAFAIAKQLKDKSCNVRVVNLNGINNIETKKGIGSENGADVTDWLSNGHTKDELLQLIKKTPYWESEPANEVQLNDQQGKHIYTEWQQLFEGTAYMVDDSGSLCKSKIAKDGEEMRLRLANFTARIRREITKDDGQSTERVFEIDGILAGGRKLFPILISSSKFASLSWPVENWGVAANICPGPGAKDSIRHAIQITGFNCESETLFTHTGWRQFNDKWVYLHGGGAIGADSVAVDLGEAKLTSYTIPTEITDLKGAISMVLKCLEVAPREVTIPLLACVFLAPLCESMRHASCEPSFIIWLTGMSGTRKSTLAGLFLSFFGRFMGKALPASFKDTENNIERKAFLLKDSILCVDDYHPVGSANEKRIMEKKAHSLIRGYGDRVGRGRMKADTTLRESFIPRGLCVVTGEDLPNLGQSATARLLALELKPGQVVLDVLTELQGKSHLLSEAMAGYLEWLLPQMDNLSVEFKKEFHLLRQKATTVGSHGRMPETVASLFIGARMAFSYFCEAGVITQEEKDTLIRVAWDILIDLSEQQGRSIQEDSPSNKFLAALKELISTKKVVLRSMWDKNVGDLDGAEHIGWEDSSFYYLLPGQTYKVVCQFYQQQGGVFPVGESMLWKHLDAAGLIQVKNDSRQINRTINKTISSIGKQVRLLHLKAAALT